MTDMKTILTMQTTRRAFYLIAGAIIPLLLHMKLYPDQTMKQALMQEEWGSAGLISFYSLAFLVLILYSHLQVRELKGLSSRVQFYLFSVTIYLVSFACLFLVIKMTGFVMFPGWLIALMDLSLVVGLILCVACIILNPLKWVVSRVLK